jgi:hypothetical protein
MRAFRACISCHDQRVKCDQGSVDNPSDPPCARCRRERIECHFATKQQRNATLQIDLDSLRHQNAEQQMELDSLRTELEALKAHHSTNDSQLARIPTPILPATETHPFDLPLPIGLSINTRCDRCITFGSTPLLPFHAGDLFMSRDEVWNDIRHSTFDSTCKMPELSGHDPVLDFTSLSEGLYCATSLVSSTSEMQSESSYYFYHFYMIIKV